MSNSNDLIEYDDDVALGYSIVKSNDEVSGVFMVDGKIKDVDYFEEEEIDKYKGDLLKIMEEMDGLKQSVINLSYRIRKLESKENVAGEIRYTEVGHK